MRNDRRCGSVDGVVERQATAVTSPRCLPETGRDLDAGVANETRVVSQDGDGLSQGGGRDHRQEGMQRQPWQSVNQRPDTAVADDQRMAI